MAKRDTQPTAVAVAVEVADQDTAEAVALRRDAIKWVTQSKDNSFMANVVDTLPAAVADEQVRLYQASKRARNCAPRPSGNRGVSTLAEVEARSRAIV